MSTLDDIYDEMIAERRKPKHPGYHLVLNDNPECDWMVVLTEATKEDAWNAALAIESKPGRSIRLYDRWGVLVYGWSLGLGTEPAS